MSFVFDQNFSCKTLHNIVTVRGDRFFSAVVVMNRFILAELNTHRMLAKNSASSRAIPPKKMLAALRKTPFIPSGFQKQHSGMQGVEYMLDVDTMNLEAITGNPHVDAPYSKAITDWTHAKDMMVEISTLMSEDGVTKQITNRLLEPFLYHTVLVSGSKEGWENFFAQRCPVYCLNEKDSSMQFRSRADLISFYGTDDTEFAEYLSEQPDLYWAQHNKGTAEIHIMQVAELIWNEYNQEPELYHDGRWALPYDKQLDAKKVYAAFPDEVKGMTDVQLQTYGMQRLIRISTAMAARTSYTTIGDEKEITYERLLEIYDQLIVSTPPHRSPLDHPVRVMNKTEYFRFKRTYTKVGPLTDQLKADIAAGVTKADSILDYFPEEAYEITEWGWCTHVRGFIPLRFMIENNLPQV